MWRTVLAELEVDFCEDGHFGHLPPLGRPEKWKNPPSIFGFLRLFEVLLGALGRPPPAIVFLCGGEALAIDLGWLGPAGGEDCSDGGSVC